MIFVVCFKVLIVLKYGVDKFSWFLFVVSLVANFVVSVSSVVLGLYKVGCWLIVILFVFVPELEESDFAVVVVL